MAEGEGERSSTIGSTIGSSSTGSSIGSSSTGSSIGSSIISFALTVSNIGASKSESADE
jgi:hypothetical protein